MSQKITGKWLWTGFVLDIALILASEFLARLIIPDYKIKNQHHSFFTVQLLLLLKFSILVYFCHHFPVILLIIAVVVLARLLYHKASLTKIPSASAAISKRLKYAKTDRAMGSHSWYQQVSTDDIRPPPYPSTGGLIRRPISHGPPPSCASPVTYSKGYCPPSSIAANTKPSYIPTTPVSKYMALADTCSKQASPPTSMHVSSLTKRQPTTSSAVCPPSYSFPAPRPCVKLEPTTPVIGAVTAKPSFSFKSPCSMSLPFSPFAAMTSLRSLPSAETPCFGSTAMPIPPGLNNTGNICFMISVIHCLSVMEEFISLLSAFPAPADETYNVLISSLQAIIVQQCQNWNLNRVSPRALLPAVSGLAPGLVAPNGIGQCQQDAGEFLMWLLDILHEIYVKLAPKDEGMNQCQVNQLTNRKKQILCCLEGFDSGNICSYRNYLVELSQVDYCLLELQNMSPIYRMCCGQILEARECDKCHKMSINLEYYTLLTLQIPNHHQDIKDCFGYFSRVEDMALTSKMLHCSCPMKDYDTAGNRLALLSRLPSHLIIQLARFSYDTFQNRAFKNQSSVVFPVSGLDLTQFTMEFKLGFGPECATRKSLYDLTGFCVHTGARSTNYGHYIAYCKVKDGSWYCFDDDHVTPVNCIEKEIEQPFISQNAYILFYKAKN